MKLSHSFFGTVSDIIKCAREKNKRMIAVNRLNSELKDEEKNINDNYALLGKYYYSNLRNINDNKAEPLCAAIDDSRNKISGIREKIKDISISDKSVRKNDHENFSHDFEKRKKIMEISRKADEVAKDYDKGIPW